MQLFGELGQTSQQKSGIWSETQESWDVCPNSSKSGFFDFWWDIRNYFTFFWYNCVRIYKFWGYSAVDLAETFILVFFSSQTDGISINFDHLFDTQHDYWTNFDANSGSTFAYRVQFWAKRGRLRSTWGLRGAKLELEGTLGASKEAPREPKRAMAIIDAAARGVQGG